MPELEKQTQKQQEVQSGDVSKDFDQTSGPKGFNPIDAAQSWMKNSPTHVAIREATQALDRITSPDFMQTTAREADALRVSAVQKIDKALELNQKREVLTPAEAASVARTNGVLRNTPVENLKDAELVVKLDRMQNTLQGKL